MIKKYVFVAVFLLLNGTISVNAQDLIVLRNGSMIEAKILEISPSEIKYRSYNHLDGPIIVIPADTVLSIRYENGMTDIINTDSATGRDKTQFAMNPDKLNFGVSLNPAGLIPFVGGGFSLSLDLTKGRFNTLINVRPFGGSNGYELFGIGLIFNYFHPSRIGGFYVGVLLEYSTGEYEIDYSYYDPYYPPNYYHEYHEYYEWETVHGFGIALNIGYKFVTRSGIYFRTGANLGQSFGYWAAPILRPELTIGFTSK